jgi:pimeloyl-ACP methyl ester carboxylesterase
MKTNPTKSVLFITGAFVGNNCWDEWITYFSSQGYHCVAPPWPHKDAPPAVLRSRQPDPAIASIRLAQLTDYFAEIASRMPEKPILIGHSIGGLIVQLLLQRDLGVMGVAIHPVPPQGIITFELSFYKSTWHPLGLFTDSDESYLMSFEDWQYIFTNGMPLEAQQEAYEKFVVPESKRVSRDGLTAAAHVDFEREHAPLLITSGSTDHIIPASLNHTNYQKYQHSHSVTDYKELEGRNHFVLGQPTWREDADYILKWLQLHQPANQAAKAFNG